MADTTHEWSQDQYLGAGLLDGLSYITSIQRYRCIRCGETLSLPLCNKKMCQHLMSLGCKGSMTKIPWKSPMKVKSIDDSEISKKDYPAKRKGNEARKRVKGVRG